MSANHARVNRTFRPRATERHRAPGVIGLSRSKRLAQQHIRPCPLAAKRAQVHERRFYLTTPVIGLVTDTQRPPMTWSISTISGPAWLPLKLILT